MLEATEQLLEPVTNSALPVKCSHCGLFFIACVSTTTAHVVIVIFPPDCNINSSGSSPWCPVSCHSAWFADLSKELSECPH